MVKRAPVVWRQEVQWQAVAFKGRSERGTGVVKVWALQRHWAVSSMVSGLVSVGWDILNDFELSSLSKCWIESKLRR